MDLSLHASFKKKIIKKKEIFCCETVDKKKISWYIERAVSDEGWGASEVGRATPL